MAAPDIDTALEWQGRTVIDRSGERIGSLEEFFLDSKTDLPEWGAVSSGLFGRRRSFVPLTEAEPSGEDELQVPFDKEHVLAAPQADPDVELSEDDEMTLYRHYGLGSSTTESAAQQQGGAPGGDEPQRDAMTRSEEEVDIRTEARPRERLRLKKYVVTEHVTKTVPVRREKIAVEREPVGDEEDAPNEERPKNT
jgi:hypothetical protein